MTTNNWKLRPFLVGDYSFSASGMQLGPLEPHRIRVLSNGVIQGVPRDNPALNRWFYSFHPIDSRTWGPPSVEDLVFLESVVRGVWNHGRGVGSREKAAEIGTAHRAYVDAIFK